MFIVRIIVVLLFCNSFIIAQITEYRCRTDELYTEQMQLPENVNTINDIEYEIQKWIKRNQVNELLVRSPVTIPIVVHVVWNDPVENICDEQILSQLVVLNEDFNAMNDNIWRVPDEFNNLTADIGIEFCLAKKDPKGLHTNGITRTKTDIKYIGEETSIFYTTEGGIDAWDTSRYLNIWLGNTQQELLGYSSMPGFSLPERDGVVINPKYFGRIGTAIDSKPYHLGRVATHEIGHYFNLFHPWKNGIGNCDSNDLVDDTPVQANAYFGCPDHPQLSCGTKDIVINFMDYVNDECMAMFTKGQKQRMLATLGTVRQNLVDSSDDLCEPVLKYNETNFIQVNPNPATGFLNVSLGIKHSEYVNKLHLIDMNGRTVHSWDNPENTLTLCLSELSNGIYTMILSTNNNKTSKKIIVLK